MKKKVVLSFLFVIIMITAMRYQGASLITEQTPRGIIDIEFAKTSNTFQKYLSAIQIRNLLVNIYIDFGFILAYALFFFYATKWIYVKNNWTRIGKAFILMGVVAGVLDIIENLLLLIVIYTNEQDALIRAVFYIASIKFFLAGIVILYILCSLPFLRSKKPQLNAEAGNNN